MTATGPRRRVSANERLIAIRMVVRDGHAPLDAAYRFGVTADTMRGWIDRPRTMAEAYAALPDKARAKMGARA